MHCTQPVSLLSFTQKDQGMHLEKGGKLSLFKNPVYLKDQKQVILHQENAHPREKLKLAH